MKPNVPVQARAASSAPPATGGHAAWNETMNHA
jgi:hypothetical protein